MLQLMNLSSSHAPEENFLEQYIPLVDFLGQAMGPNTEIVLHDLDVPDKSIIAIANGHISGRELGGPVTDFALWFMKQGDAAAVPMMTGYRAVNGEGKCAAPQAISCAIPPAICAACFVSMWNYPS